MAFTAKGDSIQLEASIEDIKLVYRTLHRYLRDHLELMDCPLFDDLQSALQEKAQAEGVDIGHHSAWDLWLGNTDAVPCEERVTKREVL
ncbi:MAG TPA: hypothetical protein DDZ83_12715 [Nitrospinae bacterium]|nr:hypothetical protein [Nitrospinota bacterium]